MHTLVIYLSQTWKLQQWILYSQYAGTHNPSSVVNCLESYHLKIATYNKNIYYIIYQNLHVDNMLSLLDICTL